MSGTRHGNVDVRSVARSDLRVSVEQHHAESDGWRHAATAGLLRSATIDAAPAELGLSDHAPIVLDVEMG